MNVATAKAVYVRIYARKKVIPLKVKIGNKIYDSNDEPIMIILDKQDVEYISDMPKHYTKYCSYPKTGYTENEIREFMKLKEGEINE